MVSRAERVETGLSRVFDIGAMLRDADDRRRTVVI